MTGPWSRVHVNGRLESAEMEWLHTNGAGAYSMSTVAMRHTRRYHGLLVAALNPPVDRYVVLSHIETTVHVGDRSYRLSVQESPDAAPTPGYRYLESFDQDPVPRWTYRIGRHRLEQTVALVHGENAAVIGFTWHGSSGVTLGLRPLLSMRRIHALMHEHGAMVQRVRLRPGEVEIRPDQGMPRVLFGHTGVFVGSPDWYRRFEYSEDKLRRTDCEEDLWTPGVFDLVLEPGKSGHLVVAVGKLPAREPAELLRETVEFWRKQDPGEERPAAVRELSVAAEQFCADACAAPGIVAGYPWLTVLARDELVAMPGLYLTRGRIEEYKRALHTLIEILTDDLLPRRVHPGARSDPQSAEASLWLFEAARHLAAQVGADDPFVRDSLYPALRRVFERVRGPRRSVLWLEETGLVASGDDDGVLSFLDARTGNPLAVPRAGLKIEIQALWSRGTETLAMLAQGFGDAATAEGADRASKRARAAFAERFWCERTRYPFDCLPGENAPFEAFSDARIRPYALVALDVDPSLFERWQAALIVERVKNRLLTVRGIRSLDPEEPGYRGEYEGTYAERRAAYYQGLAWTHLLGAYARASLRLSPMDFDLQESLRLSIEEARLGGSVLGQASEFADGEPPHRPGGCPAHATTVAELLRTLVWDLEL